MISPPNGIVIGEEFFEIIRAFVVFIHKIGSSDAERHTYNILRVYAHTYFC
jgi:hypothetical protein